MENKLLYNTIIKTAVCIMITTAIVVAVATQDILQFAGVMIGGGLATMGFIWIIVMTQTMGPTSNAKAIAMGHYLFRYLLYAVVFMISMHIGINILSILLGFLSINLAIKFSVYRQRKEED